MDSFNRWWALLVQLFEYFVLAAQEFKNTDAGRKEWQDILDAYEQATQMDLNDDGRIGRVPNTAPQARSAQQQPRAPEQSAPEQSAPEPVQQDETGNRRIFE